MSEQRESAPASAWRAVEELADLAARVEEGHFQAFADIEEHIDARIAALRAEPSPEPQRAGAGLVERAKAIVQADAAGDDRPEHVEHILRDLAALPTEPDGAKADAGGVAVLRRLREEIAELLRIANETDTAAYTQARRSALDGRIAAYRQCMSETDRLLAEAESQPDGEAREVDDVLRDWLERYENAKKRGFQWEEDSEALAVLAKRALEGR